MIRSKKEMEYKTDTRQSPHGLCLVKIGIIKAEALLHCNPSALLLGCFRLGFPSTFSIGTEELNDAFNRNPDRYYQNTDIYHCQ